MVPLIVLVEISWGHAYGSQENPWSTAPSPSRPLPPPPPKGFTQKEILLFDQNIILSLILGLQ